MKNYLSGFLLRSVVCSSLLALVTFSAVAQTPTIWVGGNEVLASADARFPIWIPAGTTLSCGTNVKSISVIEYLSIPAKATTGGVPQNIQQYNQVITVTAVYPSVQTVPTTTPATVWKIEGVALNTAAFNAGAKGPTGPTGVTGPTGLGSATVAVGTTTTGAAGTSASVSNSGTTTAAILDFTIPQGATGPLGPAGPTGPTGPAASGTGIVTVSSGVVQAGGLMTGDVTSTGTGLATTIANSAVTYAKMQNVSATSRLLGRASTGAGVVEELTIGSGLSLSGNTLSASGTNYWTLTGSDIYNNNNSGAGKVGVGTNGAPLVSMDVNGGLSTRVTTTSGLTSGGTITVGNSSHIIIGQGSATNTNWPFSISNGSSGQYLTLEMSSGLYAQLPNTGNVKLYSAAAFIPYSTLTIKWDGTQWVEIARSFGTATTVPLNLPTYYNGKQTFTYTGNNQTWTAPFGVTSVFVKLWGAGGGANTNAAAGGGGAYISGNLPVIPGQTLAVIVGQGGATTATFGGGGAGGTPAAAGTVGGAGGGRSAIQGSGAELVTAAGGGGGGGNFSNCYGGGGGYYTGANGGAGSNTGGGGGSNIAAGAAGYGSIQAGNAGSFLQGGAGFGYSSSGYYGGGGGGGGYYGGGGGGSGSSQPSGGGGGGSYANASMTSISGGAGNSGTNSSCGAGGTAGNTSDSDYSAGIGKGATGCSATAAGNGLIVIYW